MAKKKGPAAADDNQSAEDTYAELAAQGKGVPPSLREEEKEVPAPAPAEGLTAEQQRIAELEAKLARAEEALASKGQTSGESSLRPITFDPNDDDPVLDEYVIPGVAEVRAKSGSGGRSNEMVTVPTWRELKVHPRDVDDGPQYDEDGNRLPCRFIKRTSGNLVEWR